MKTLLHLRSNPEPGLLQHVMESQRTDPACSVLFFDLHDPTLDEEQLLQKIFEADSIAVW